MKYKYDITEEKKQKLREITMKAEVKSLVKSKDVEKLRSMLSEKKIHVCYVEHIVNELKDELFDEVIEHRISREEYDKKFDALENLIDTITSEYHDFTTPQGVLTLPKGEWIHTGN
jgi:hypothetical protein